MKKRKEPISPESLAEVFKALSDPTRLKIVKLLSTRGKVLCVGGLAHKLGISQPAVSQHLRVLRSAGIVEAQRFGFHVHYVFNPAVLHRHKRMIDLLFNTAFECCKSDVEGHACCTSDED
jgi:ArsR family transcriptional regulator